MTSRPYLIPLSHPTPLFTPFTPANKVSNSTCVSFVNLLETSIYIYSKSGPLCKNIDHSIGHNTEKFGGNPSIISTSKLSTVYSDYAHIFRENGQAYRYKILRSYGNYEFLFRVWARTTKCKP